MNIRCRFECEGHICRRWAMRGSNFCYNHQPKPNRVDQGEFLHPLARLATPEDVFDVVRETLNAARLGRIPVGQAYAVGFLAQTLLKIREQLAFEHRNDAIYRQLIPTIADEESAEDTEAAVAPFLPVEAAEELTLELPVAEAQPLAGPPALPPSEAAPQIAGFDRFVAEFNHHLAATAPEKTSHRGTSHPASADHQLEAERTLEQFGSAKSA